MLDLKPATRCHILISGEYLVLRLFLPKNNGIRRITIDDPKRRSSWGRLVAINVILRVYYFTSLYRSSANRVRRSDIYDVIPLQEIPIWLQHN